MAPLTLKLDDLGQHVGEQLGASSWHEVTQDQVGLFADATGDHQWIHLDPERAASGPFGGTVAHGFLTLSMAPLLVAEVVGVADASVTINYGLNKVRFPAPLPVGAEWRGGLELSEVSEIPGGAQMKLHVTIEVKGSEKPCLVADALVRVYG